MYTDKTKTQSAPLTKSAIEEHLLGRRVIGMYPLLQDNTTWLVAADFDGDRWIVQVKSLFKYCTDASIPCCIERSRSGKGGHIWWFFHERYPAYKGRRIFLHVLKESGDLTQKKRQERFAQAQSGHYQIILVTGQLIGEGTHFENLDCLFLVFPF